jgi:hypothetical protein
MITGENLLKLTTEKPTGRGDRQNTWIHRKKKIQRKKSHRRHCSA